MSRSVVMAVAACSLAGSPPARGGEALSPPFDLKWGDTPARLVAWADDLRLDKTWQERGADPGLTILTITAPDGQLPDHAASALEARFTEGRLFEVAVHYDFPGQTRSSVRALFLSLKKRLTLKHGAFRPGGIRRRVEDGIVIKSEAYRVTPAEDYGLVLAYTELRDAKRGDSAAEFTLLYRNGTIGKRNGEGALPASHRAGPAGP